MVVAGAMDMGIWGHVGQRVQTFNYKMSMF